VLGDWVAHVLQLCEFRPAMAALPFHPTHDQRGLGRDLRIPCTDFSAGSTAATGRVDARHFSGPDTAVLLPELPKHGTPFRPLAPGILGPDVSRSVRARLHDNKSSPGHFVRPQPGRGIATNELQVLQLADPVRYTRSDRADCGCGRRAQPQGATASAALWPLANGTVGGAGLPAGLPPESHPSPRSLSATPRRSGIVR